MTARNDFDGIVSDWLADEAGRGAPDYLAETLARTTVIRQRPAWSSLERWLPVQLTFNDRLAPIPRLAWVAALLAMLVLAACCAAPCGRRAATSAPFRCRRQRPDRLRGWQLDQDRGRRRHGRSADHHGAGRRGGADLLARWPTPRLSHRPSLRAIDRHRRRGRVPSDRGRRRRQPGHRGADRVVARQPPSGVRGLECRPRVHRAGRCGRHASPPADGARRRDGLSTRRGLPTAPGSPSSRARSNCPP